MTATIRELRKALGDTQMEFAKRYGIPFRTIQNWEAGINIPSSYVLNMLNYRVCEDMINRKLTAIPKYSSRKLTIPSSEDYRSPAEWLRAVSDRIGGNAVFALDSALICSGMYLGRLGEWAVWVYGSDQLSKYNGLCVIGNDIDPLDIEEHNGLRYTCFNRTLNDSMANEEILDMQGITEALSRYYFMHNESFTGLHPDPKYDNLFQSLSRDAIEYYTY